MLRFLILIVGVACFIGCGVDTPMTPDVADEAVPAAPPATTAVKLVDITQWAFTVFEKEGESYHLRVYQHKDCIEHNKHRIILKQSATTAPTTWEISFASKMDEGDQSIELIESAVVKRYKKSFFNSIPHRSFKVYANKEDARKAKKRYRRFQQWQKEQRQALIDAGIISE